MPDSPYRIFAGVLPHGMGPPRPLPEQSSPELVPELPIVQRDQLLAAVSRILDAEPEPGESVQRSFDRKERELRAYCDQLDHDDRDRLWLRLVA